MLSYTWSSGQEPIHGVHRSAEPSTSKQCSVPALSREQSRPHVKEHAVKQLSRAVSRKGHNALSVALRAVRADQQADTLSTNTLELIASLTRSVEEKHAEILQESQAQLADVKPAEPNELKKRLLATIRDLQKGLLERETEVRLLLLAALAGEHLLLLGPPGTAKSELARRLSKLAGGQYYERLLTRFSVPEELFGPLSMKGLENDEYVRQTAGYLPTAEVAFVDEIFKANSAILNALLTLLNERLFDNGNQRLPVPLLCLVGASNELPESEELDALFDRFLIRRQVAQVSSTQLASLARLAAGIPLPSQAPSPPASPSSNGTGPHPPTEADPQGHSIGDLGIADFRAAADAAHKAVGLPDSVVDVLTQLRDYLQDKCEPPVYVSDRRFMKAVQLLQVAAHADGRDQINEYDCLLLEHVFGQRPDDSHKVRSFVLETIASDPGLQQTELVFLGLFGRSCRVLDSQQEQDIVSASSEAGELVELLALRQSGLALTLGAGFPDLHANVWQSEASVRGAMQALTPQMTENKKRVEELLREALTLWAVLEQRAPSGVLERLLPKRFKQYQKGISSRV